MVLWLAAAALAAGLALVPARAGASDSVAYSATRTLTLLSPSAFGSDDPSDGWVLQGRSPGPGQWLGVARAQVTKYASNSGVCTPTGYLSLHVVSPDRGSYKDGLVYAEKNGSSLLPQPIPLDGSGTADISGVHADPHGTLPQFDVVLSGAGTAPTSVDVQLSWTGVADAACAGATAAAPTLKVIKHVVGGGASAGRWSLHVRDATGADVAGSPQAGSETGTTYTLSAGTFTVAETGDISGYTGSFSGDCDAKGAVTLAAGDTKTCTLTNTFASTAPPTLTVIKHVVGGGASAGRWSLHVRDANGADVPTSPQPGSETGTTYTLAAGTFTVAETGDLSGYTGTFSGDCSAAGAVTLAAGDTKTCTLTNTFADTTPPVIQGPSDLTATATSAAGAVVSYDVTATDPDDPAVAVSCVSSPAGLKSGSTFPFGVTGIHCTASDAAGNAATPVDFTVTVVDAAPFLTLPANIVDSTTDQGGKVETFSVSATDYEDGALLVTCDHASGSTFPVGVTTVLCSATNSSKLTTMGSFTVTITYLDRTAPTLHSPGDQTATATSSAGATVSFEVTATDPDNTAGDLTVACVPASGSTFPIGATTVTCHAHDPAGNEAAPVTLTVTVNDAPPILNVPSNIVDSTTDQGGKIETFSVSATDYKDGALDVSCDHASGDTFAVGTTTVHCSATNSSKQTTTGSFTVTITYLDRTAPTLRSPGDQTATATSAAGAKVSFVVTATDPDNTAGDLTIVCAPASGSTFAIGMTTVTCNAHDPAGNAATPVSFTVTVVDAAPFLTLPANIVDSTTDQGGKVETFSVSATDYEDGALLVTCDHASGSTFPVGVTTVLCSATNSSKLTTMGSFTVTITYLDRTAPTLHSPGDQTATATSAAGATVSFEVAATDPDNTAGDLTVVCAPASGSTFPIGATTVTCNAHDPAGNQAEPISFTVTVADAPPVLSLPKDITDTTNDPRGKVETFSVSATDYKDGALDVSCDHVSGATFPVGTTTVHCSATNSSKQTTTGSFTITVGYVDITPPVLHSPGDRTAPATSSAGAAVSFDVTATDPDDQSSALTIVCGPLQSGDTFPIGVVTETCNAHDAAGNRAEPISFTVTVADAPPILSLPKDLVDTTNDPTGKAETFSATATDYKDGALTVSCDHASGSTFPVGVTTVLCSATNSSKQTSSGSFTVTISYTDVTPPELHGPGDLTVTATSAAGAVVSYEVTAVDPDDPVLTPSCSSTPGGLDPGSVFPFGVTAIHCTASDAAGNAAAPLDFTVTVDDAAPFVTVPSHIEDTTNDPQGKAETFSATATDYKDGTLTVSCDHASGSTFPVGTTTVLCSATNSSKLTTMASFTVTIDYVDLTAPRIQSPGDQTATATSADGAKVSFDVTATDPDDASSVLTVVCDHASGSAFTFGVTPVTCTAHDPAGNQATPVSFTVTVNDAPPALALPNDITDTTSDPQGKAVTFSATATDYKDGPLTVSCDHTSGDTFPVGTTTVHCSATNSSKQTTSGSFTVTLAYVDRTPPVLHSPGDQTATATSADGATVPFDVTATDPYDPAGSLTVLCAPASGSTFPIGATTVTCTAHDLAGNQATPVTFTVTVNDAPPALSLPKNITDTSNDPQGKAVTFAVSATDFKDGTAPVVCDRASGGTFPVGSTTVHCGATNSSGQTTSGSFTVTVAYVDVTAPTIHAPADQTVTATSKNGAAVSFDVTATDPDDASDTLTVVCDHDSGSTFPIATTTVTCEAQDAAGNHAEPVAFTVTVTDAPPALSLPNDIHDVTHVPTGKTETFSVTASDFEDGSTPVTCDHTSGDSFPVGTTTVHCSATNGSGQKTSGSFAVTVDYVDTSAPVIHTSGDQQVAATSANGAAVSYTATADDPDDAAAKLGLACSPLQSGATFPVGVTTITCTASDPAGNQAAPATFTVTVDPLPAPAAPAAPTVSVSVSGPAFVRVGSNVSFRIAVKSSGNAPSTGVEVRAQVPDGATLVSTSGTGTCTGQTALVCVFGTVPGGATESQTVVLRADRAGSLSLFAVVSGDGAAGSSSASTTVLDVDAPPPAPPAPSQPDTFNAISTGTVLVNGAPKPSDTLFLIVSGDHIKLTGLLWITTPAGNSGLFSNVPFGAPPGPPTSFVVTIVGASTTLTLEGGDFSICSAPRRTAAADPKTVVRQLWGKAKGSFTTKAKYSSATIRGTTWGVQDRCDGTLSIAVDDFVDVVDFSTKKTLTLVPGQTYLATPPRKPAGSFRPPSQSAANVRAHGLVWAGHRFRTKAQFSAWLSSKGSSWRAFAAKHPALAKALAARRA